jgi:hypothetical protein
MKKILFVVFSIFTVGAFAQMRAYNEVNGTFYHSNFGMKFFVFFNKQDFQTCMQYLSPKSKLGIDSLKKKFSQISESLPSDFFITNYSETSTENKAPKSIYYYEKTYYKWGNESITYFCQVKLVFDSESANGKIIDIQFINIKKVIKHDFQIKKIEKKADQQPSNPPPPPKK